MIYWDNAATTFPKPVGVIRAVKTALQQFGANPGRGGYPMSLQSAREIYSCRETVARFFHLSNPAGVIFTMNCTMALNIVIKGLLRDGGRAVVSDLEHNAVMRPLQALSPSAPVYDVAVVVPGDIPATVENFRRRIGPSTKAIICTHASNVCGYRLPIREIGALAKAYGLIFVVDSAQGAGVLPIDMEADHIDYLCLPGHKGLYGPMGVGLLLCAREALLPSFYEGGTGSQSLLLTQPEELPDRFESGTPNVAGICGLHAGLQWVMNRGGPEAIQDTEMTLLSAVYDRLAQNPRVTLYTPRPRMEQSVPVLSFNIRGQASEATAARLGQLGIATRAGLHCAPAAHRKLGTLPEGTVRLSPGGFSTMQEGYILCKIIDELSRKPLQ